MSNITKILKEYQDGLTMLSKKITPDAVKKDPTLVHHIDHMKVIWLQNAFEQLCEHLIDKELPHDN